MADRIAADSGLTETQSGTLKNLLDHIVPPDAERGMPGASEMDVIGYVLEFSPEQLDTIRDELDAFEDMSQKRLGASFSELSSDDAEELFTGIRASQPRFGFGLIVETLSCYYQDDRVVAALGYPAGPPFPTGNEVEKGDLTLLEPVKQMGKLYRE